MTLTLTRHQHVAVCAWLLKPLLRSLPLCDHRLHTEVDDRAAPLKWSQNFWVVPWGAVGGTGHKPRPRHVSGWNMDRTEKSKYKSDTFVLKCGFYNLRWHFKMWDHFGKALFYPLYPNTHCYIVCSKNRKIAFYTRSKLSARHLGSVCVFVHYTDAQTQSPQQYRTEDPIQIHMDWIFLRSGLTEVPVLVSDQVDSRWPLLFT